jgi:hypothetical protein
MRRSGGEGGNIYVAGRRAKIGLDDPRNLVLVACIRRHLEGRSGGRGRIVSRCDRNGETVTVKKLLGMSQTHRNQILP